MDSNKLPFSLFDFFAIIFPGAVGIFAVYLFFDPTISQFQLSEVNVLFTFFLIVASYIGGHILHAASEIVIDRLANITVGSIVGQYLNQMGLAEKAGGNREKDKKPLAGLVNIEWDPDILFAWKGLKKDSQDVAEDGRTKRKNKKDYKTGSLIEECLKREFHEIPQRINHIFQLVLVYSQKNTKGEYNEVPTFAALEAMFRSLALATGLLFGVVLGKFHSVFKTIDLLLLSAILIFLVGLFLYSYRRYKRMWVETIFAQFIVSSSDKHPFTKTTESKPNVKSKKE